MALTFAVVAEFDVPKAVRTRFMDEAYKDALSSCQNEIGCLQFDVLVQSNSSDRVMFYEVYASRESFDEHLKTQHLKIFQSALENLSIKELPVRFFEIERKVDS